MYPRKAQTLSSASRGSLLTRMRHKQGNRRKTGLNVLGYTLKGTPRSRGKRSSNRLSGRSSGGKSSLFSLTNRKKVEVRAVTGGFDDSDDDDELAEINRITAQYKPTQLSACMQELQPERSEQWQDLFSFEQACAVQMLRRKEGNDIRTGEPIDERSETAKPAVESKEPAATTEETGTKAPEKKVQAVDYLRVPFWQQGNRAFRSRRMIQRRKQLYKSAYVQDWLKVYWATLGKVIWATDKPDAVNAGATTSEDNDSVASGLSALADNSESSVISRSDSVLSDHDRSTADSVSLGNRPSPLMVGEQSSPPPLSSGTPQFIEMTSQTPTQTVFGFTDPKHRDQSDNLPDSPQSSLLGNLVMSPVSAAEKSDPESGLPISISEMDDLLDATAANAEGERKVEDSADIKYRNELEILGKLIVDGPDSIADAKGPPEIFSPREQANDTSSAQQIDSPSLGGSPTQGNRLRVLRTDLMDRLSGAASSNPTKDAVARVVAKRPRFPEDGRTALTFDQYRDFYFRVYKALHFSWDGGRAYKLCCRDWVRDTIGSKYTKWIGNQRVLPDKYLRRVWMSYAEFTRSLFQIVDHWTVSVEESEYIKFLQVLFFRITYAPSEFESAANESISGMLEDRNKPIAEREEKKVITRKKNRLAALVRKHVLNRDMMIKSIVNVFKEALKHKPSLPDQQTGNIFDTSGKSRGIVAALLSTTSVTEKKKALIHLGYHLGEDESQANASTFGPRVLAHLLAWQIGARGRWKAFSKKVKKSKRDTDEFSTHSTLVENDKQKKQQGGSGAGGGRGSAKSGSKGIGGSVGGGTVHAGAAWRELGEDEESYKARRRKQQAQKARGGQKTTTVEEFNLSGGRRSQHNIDQVVSTVNRLSVSLNRPMHRHEDHSLLASIDMDLLDSISASIHELPEETVEQLQSLVSSPRFRKFSRDSTRRSRSSASSGGSQNERELAGADLAMAVGEDDSDEEVEHGMVGYLKTILDRRGTVKSSEEMGEEDQNRLFEPSGSNASISDTSSDDMLIRDSLVEKPRPGSSRGVRVGTESMNREVFAKAFRGVIGRRLSRQQSFTTDDLRKREAALAVSPTASRSSVVFRKGLLGLAMEDRIPGGVKRKPKNRNRRLRLRGFKTPLMLDRFYYRKRRHMHAKSMQVLSTAEMARLDQEKSRRSNQRFEDYKQDKLDTKIGSVHHQRAKTVNPVPGEHQSTANNNTSSLAVVNQLVVDPSRDFQPNIVDPADEVSQFSFSALALVDGFGEAKKKQPKEHHALLQYDYETTFRPQFAPHHRLYNRYVRACRIERHRYHFDEEKCMYADELKSSDFSKWWLYDETWAFDQDSQEAERKREAVKTQASKSDTEGLETDVKQSVEGKDAPPHQLFTDWRFQHIGRPGRDIDEYLTERLLIHEPPIEVAFAQMCALPFTVRLRAKDPAMRELLQRGLAYKDRLEQVDPELRELVRVHALKTEVALRKEEIAQQERDFQMAQAGILVVDPARFINNQVRTHGKLMQSAAAWLGARTSISGLHLDELVNADPSEAVEGENTDGPSLAAVYGQHHLVAQLFDAAIRDSSIRLPPELEWDIPPAETEGKTEGLLDRNEIAKRAIYRTERMKALEHDHGWDNICNYGEALKEVKIQSRRRLVRVRNLVTSVRKDLEFRRDMERLRRLEAEKQRTALAYEQKQAEIQAKKRAMELAYNKRRARAKALRIPLFDLPDTETKATAPDSETPSVHTQGISTCVGEKPAEKPPTTTMGLLSQMEAESAELRRRARPDGAMVKPDTQTVDAQSGATDAEVLVLLQEAGLPAALGVWGPAVVAQALNTANELDDHELLAHVSGDSAERWSDASPRHLSTSSLGSLEEFRQLLSEAKASLDAEASVQPDSLNAPSSPDRRRDDSLHRSMQMREYKSQRLHDRLARCRDQQASERQAKRLHRRERERRAQLMADDLNPLSALVFEHMRRVMRQQGMQKVGLGGWMPADMTIGVAGEVIKGTSLDVPSAAPSSRSGEDERRDQVLHALMQRFVRNQNKKSKYTVRSRALKKKTRSKRRRQLAHSQRAPSLVRIGERKTETHASEQGAGWSQRSEETNSDARAEGFKVSEAAMDGAVDAIRGFMHSYEELKKEVSAPEGKQHEQTPEGVDPDLHAYIMGLLGFAKRPSAATPAGVDASFLPARDVASASKPAKTTPLILGGGFVRCADTRKVVQRGPEQVGAVSELFHSVSEGTLREIEAYEVAHNGLFEVLRPAVTGPEEPAGTMLSKSVSMSALPADVEHKRPSQLTSSASFDGNSQPHQSKAQDDAYRFMGILAPSMDGLQASPRVFRPLPMVETLPAPTDPPMDYNSPENAAPVVVEEVKTGAEQEWVDDDEQAHRGFKEFKEDQSGRLLRSTNELRSLYRAENQIIKEQDVLPVSALEEVYLALTGNFDPEQLETVREVREQTRRNITSDAKSVPDATDQAPSDASAPSQSKDFAKSLPDIRQRAMETAASVGVNPGNNQSSPQLLSEYMTGATDKPSLTQRLRRAGRTSSSDEDMYQSRRLLSSKSWKRPPSTRSEASLRQNGIRPAVMQTADQASDPINRALSRIDSKFVGLLPPRNAGSTTASPRIGSIANGSAADLAVMSQAPNGVTGQRLITKHDLFNWLQSYVGLRLDPVRRREIPMAARPRAIPTSDPRSLTELACQGGSMRMRVDPAVRRALQKITTLNPDHIFGSEPPRKPRKSAPSPASTTAATVALAEEDMDEATFAQAVVEEEQLGEYVIDRVETDTDNETVGSKRVVLVDDDGNSSMYSAVEAPDGREYKRLLSDLVADTHRGTLHIPEADSDDQIHDQQQQNAGKDTNVESRGGHEGHKVETGSLSTPGDSGMNTPFSRATPPRSAGSRYAPEGHRGRLSEHMSSLLQLQSARSMADDELSEDTDDDSGRRQFQVSSRNESERPGFLMMQKASENLALALDLDEHTPGRGLGNKSGSSSRDVASGRHMSARSDEMGGFDRSADGMSLSAPASARESEDCSVVDSWAAVHQTQQRVIVDKGPNYDMHRSDSAGDQAARTAHVPAHGAEPRQQNMQSQQAPATAESSLKLLPPLLPGSQARFYASPHSIPVEQRTGASSRVKVFGSSFKPSTEKKTTNAQFKHHRQSRGETQLAGIFRLPRVGDFPSTRKVHPHRKRRVASHSSQSGGSSPQFSTPMGSSRPPEHRTRKNSFAFRREAQHEAMSPKAAVPAQLDLPSIVDDDTFPEVDSAIISASSRGSFSPGGASLNPSPDPRGNYGDIPRSRASQELSTLLRHGRHIRLKHKPRSSQMAEGKERDGADSGRGWPTRMPTDPAGSANSQTQATPVPLKSPSIYADSLAFLAHSQSASSQSLSASGPEDEIGSRSPSRPLSRLSGLTDVFSSLSPQGRFSSPGSPAGLGAGVARAQRERGQMLAALSAKWRKNVRNFQRAQDHLVDVLRTLGKSPKRIGKRS